MIDDNNFKLIDLLANIANNPQYSLLHEECYTIITLIQQITEQYKPINNKKKKPGENQVFIEGKYYNIPEENKWDALFSVYNNKIKDLPIDEELFIKKLNKIFDIIKTSDKKNSKFINYFKFVFASSTIEEMTYDYLSYLICTGFRHEDAFTHSHLSIELGNYFNRFLLTQFPKMKLIYDCFDSIKAQIVMEKKESIFMVDFCKIILEHPLDSEPIQELFNQLNVKETFIKKVLYFFFRDMLFSEYENNNIHLMDLHVFIKNIFNVETAIISHNINTQYALEIGYYFLDFLIDHGIFEKISKYSNKNKNHTINFIIPTSEILTLLTKKSKLEGPFLTMDQCTIRNNKREDNTNFDNIILKNLKNMIHRNKRMNVEMLEEAYLNQEKLVTKFSVNTNYLKNYLYYLINNDFTDDLLLAELNIDIGELYKLNSVGNHYSGISNILIEIAKNYKVIVTAPQVMKKISEYAKLNNFSYKDYQTVIENLVNKICQKKLSNINVLKQAIKYSVFKYFIVTEYFCVRFRRYLMDFPLNIHTNAFAKTFVKMYNNEQSEITIPELNIIGSTVLKHDLTKKELTSLIIKLKPNADATIISVENHYKIIEYILTFFKKEYADMKVLEDLIYNKKFHNYMYLYEILNAIVNSKKKVSLVHSLIEFEQQQLLGQNPRHMMNYHERDISQSGLQVITDLFRDPDLGKTSGMLGSTPSDLYYKTTVFIFDIYKILIGLHDLCWDMGIRFNEKDYLELKSTTTQEEFRQFKDNFGMCLSAWINLDFKFSSIRVELSMALVKFVREYMCNNNINYPASSILNTILDCMDTTTKNMISLIHHSEIKGYEKEFKFLLCLRFATRITRIGKYEIGIIEDDPKSIFKTRDLAKNLVMTLVYMSTPYGRRETYMEILNKIKPIPDNPPYYKSYCREFAGFLDRCGTKFLQDMPEIRNIYNFLNDVCALKMPITIKNRNFKLTIRPTIETFSQISCPSYTSNNRRPAQLTMKCRTNAMDYDKFKAMFMANLAHFMDSDLMHHFVELCLEINKRLEQLGYQFRIIFERNHDCFITNCPILMDILLKEVYLRFIQYPYLKHMTIPDEIKETYQTMSDEEFIEYVILNLNPYAFK